MSNAGAMLLGREILISAVVPVYNEELMIKDSISYFTEEFKKKYQAELIISDGGSQDLTIEKAKPFADKIVLHSESRRQTIAEGRNRGADAAAGKILVFINGDTIPEDPDQLFGFVLSCIKSGKYSGYDAFACTVTAKPEEMFLKDRVFYKCHNAYMRLLNFIGLGMCRGECQIVKTWAFRKVGGNNELLAAGEDFDLFRRLGKVIKIKFIKELVVYESPRRFRKYGYIKILWYWLLNSLSVMAFSKSVSKDWDAVR